MALPVLKYPGGKRKLAQVILEALGPVPRGSTYCEPFCGGAAVFFAMRTAQPHVAANISDVNGELINLYEVIRDQHEALIGELKDTSYYVYEASAYYKIRAAEPTAQVDRAARTIYLNKCGYNGMYRLNSKGKFNIPFGKYDNPRILDEEGIRAASEALAGSHLFTGGFAKAAYPPRSVIYMDPPYVPTSKTANFTGYSEAFGVDQQRALAAFAGQLVRDSHRVAVSNSDTPLVRELYKTQPFDILEITAGRSVSCKGDARAKVTELLMVGATKLECA